MDETNTSAAEAQRSAETTIQYERDVLFVHPSEHSNLALTTSPLDGTNFLAWQRVVYVSLGTKMKLGFIDGSFPRPAIGSINFESWRRVDLMVTSWIWNSMSKDIVESFMFCATREIYGSQYKHDTVGVMDLWFTSCKEKFLQFHRTIYHLQHILQKLQSCGMSLVLWRQYPSVDVEAARVELIKLLMISLPLLRGHARDNCFQLHGVPEWYKMLADKKKKGRSFAANIENKEEATNTSSQNVADIVAEVLKVMHKNTAPSDPLTNFANYAHFDNEFAGNTVIPTEIDENCWIVDSGASNHDQDTKDSLVMGVLFRRLYIYKQDQRVPTEFSNNSFHNVSCSASFHCSVSVWHNRLGHASVEAIKHIQEVDCTEFSSNIPCDTCHKAKQSRIPFPVSSSHATAIFDLVHMDLWGPYKANSISGCTYLLTLVDDHSRCLWIFLLKQKNQVPTVLHSFCSMVQNQFGKGIKIFRSDNGSEFINQECRMLCANFGIIHQTSCSYTPQQNGRVERKHRHLLNIARALLLQASLPIKFWSDAILTAAYLINRTPTKVLGWKTPYEKLYGKDPQYIHLRTFGSLCYATDLTPHKSKFHSRALRCILIGYAMHQKAYKLFDLDNQTVLFSRDVHFYEGVFPYSSTQSITPSLPMPTVTLQSDNILDASSQSATLIEQDDIPTSTPVHVPRVTDSINPEPPPLRRSQRQTHKPSWLNDFELRTYLEAVKHVEWQDAMKAELNALERNSAHGWPLQQVDVNNAFLHGHLDEDLYMTPPEGYTIAPGLVCKLARSIYGLKQASRQWNAELTLKLLEFGFKQSAHDHSPTLGLIQSVKDYLHSLFTIKDLGEARYFLGLEIARSSDGLYVAQNKLVGRLLYLGFTRPDISHSVQQLSQFLTRPCEEHWRAAVHVVRYLKGTPTKGLFLPSSSSFLLRAYCDADWASCTDSRRSLTVLLNLLTYFTKALGLKIFAAFLDKLGLAVMHPSPTCRGDVAYPDSVAVAIHGSAYLDEEDDVVLDAG
ncbi:UNVERIFIED_CONTAM: Retrovirus-related Pol polyprotein from transposon TNT 1-94 [Sesamum radiatum]|uniref:Retrovirus-related Pol polyprotein from transposon TNT 1-94 n=1 Tax=Sesamum radiatum TaxID=300843 RepID=A0AAW2KRX0_SESRA